MLGDDELAEQPDDTHRAVWRYLAEVSRPYPSGLDVPPLRPGEGPGRPKRWGAIYVEAGDVSERNAGLSLHVVCDHGRKLAPTPAAGQLLDPAVVAALLFSRARRGVAYVLGRGARADLHAIFRVCYHQWLSLGYEIVPLVSGSEVRCVTVRRDKHAWHLVDWRSLTGLDAEVLTAPVDPVTGASCDGVGKARALLAQVERWAAFVRDTFGVEPRLTLGQTAVAAAAQVLPNDRWLWRPSRIAVALCREGGAFRGGYCHYPVYRGPGHKIDMRRAYTWALAQELPAATAYGKCEVDGYERAGIFVCDVHGPGLLPVNLAVWRDGPPGFARRNWSGDRCVCVLPSAEFAGLRALGYRVRPGRGVTYLRRFTLAGLSARAEQALARYGADSLEGQAAKRLTNAVYGKLAAGPDTERLVFSAGEPGPGHLPFLDAAGREVDGAWVKPVSVYRSYQHVDVAAEITALVRTEVYTAGAKAIHAGIGVIGVDTDCLMTRGDPRGVIEMAPDRPGGWRYLGYNRRVTINGPRLASFGDTAISAGTGGVTPEQIALIYERGVLAVEGKVMAPPWSEGASARDVTRRLRRHG